MTHPLQVLADSMELQGDGMEWALCGAVMRDGTTFPEAYEIVKPDEFHNWSCRHIWTAMEKLTEQGLGIDTLTVGDQLERMNVVVKQQDFSGRFLLTKIRENGHPDLVKTYAENVLDYHQKGLLSGIFSQGAEWSLNGRRADAIIKDVTAMLSQITPHSAQDEYTVPVNVALDEAYDLTDKASRGELTGVSTGFVDLDRLLGGYLPQNIYLVAARTGQGKTAFLLQQALHASKAGSKVCFFSLEMSRAQIVQRLIAQEAEIDLLNGIIRGRMTSEEWDRYHAAVGIIEKLPITINDLSSININQIRQTARKIAPDIIFIDYIQLADSGEKKTERRELEVSAVSRGLKYLARELNVPIVPAAQLSRAVESRADKMPILSDLRESGSLEQDAYCVMFIHTVDAIQNARQVLIAKHRNGPTGSVDLKFVAPFAKFDNSNSYMFRPNEKEE